MTVYFRMQINQYIIMLQIEIHSNEILNKYAYSVVSILFEYCETTSNTWILFDILQLDRMQI